MTNYYKKLHATVLGTLLGTSLACAVVPFVYRFGEMVPYYDFFFMVSKTFWVAGSTIILTIMFCYSDEEKEVLK